MRDLSTTVEIVTKTFYMYKIWKSGIVAVFACSFGQVLFPKS